MGEIIIEVPSTTKRRYRLTNKSSVNSIIAELDATAVRVRKNTDSLNEQQLEDLKDGRAADEALRINKRFHSQADIEKMLGL